MFRGEGVRLLRWKGLERLGPPPSEGKGRGSVGGVDAEGEGSSRA